MGNRASRVGHVALWGALVACSGCVPTTRYAYSNERLREILTQRARTISPDLEIVVPHAVTAEQLDRARRVVERAVSAPGRAELLLSALVDGADLGLRYADRQTTIAAEALRDHRGNCFAIASAVVGLARGLGIEAYYVDLSNRRVHVEQRDNWVERSGHIGAVVRTDRGYSGLEVGDRWVRTNLWHRISDLEATAHYYNNRGYELIAGAQGAGAAIPWDAATASFSMAAALNPGWAGPVNNLGVVAAHRGDLVRAEMLYRRAMALDPEGVAPLSNLGGLLLRQRRWARAEAVLRAAHDRDPNSAPIAKKLSRAVLWQGRPDEAARWLVKAAAIEGLTADEDVLRQELRVKYGRGLAAMPEDET